MNRNFKICKSITDRQDASLISYFRDIAHNPRLTQEEEIELSKRIKNGDQKALEKLVNSNLRFVISIAKQFQKKGLPLIDLVQEGNIGLVEAAQRYDETKGFKFTSYAVWWIRQSIIKALSDQGRTVRIPISQIICLNKVNKIIEQFEQEHDRKPSIDELHEITNYDHSKLNSIIENMNRSVSLESPMKTEDANCLLDIIPNTNAEDTDKEVSKNDLSNEIENILSKLPFRNRDVLRMSFGIGMNSINNEEIANYFGIGVERVRQIIKQTVKYIRIKYGDKLKELI